MEDRVIAAFFSYSRSDSDWADSVEQVVKVAKQRVGCRGDWRVVDAFDPRPDERVADQVEGCLRQSDVLIAELTGLSSNVMFEVGFARANRYPVILLVNQRFLEKVPLPADLGGLEYISYRPLELEPGGIPGLRTKIDDQLDKVRQELQPGLISLRRGERRLQGKTDELAANTREQTDPPLLRLLGGWLEKVVGELGDAGSRGFHVSPKYYPACFSKFRDTERHTAFAIADLSDQTESMSILDTSEANMAVRERIFLISGRQFFDQPMPKQPKLSEIFPRLRQHFDHSRSADPKYRVLIARSDDLDLPPAHPVPGSRSKDLLLITPDIVGGYLRLADGPSYLQDDHSYLRIVMSGEEFVKARKFYDSVRAAAFRFDKAWEDADGMRASWLDHEKKVGNWIKGWTHDLRDPVYYELYDLHIRTWVPGYDDFIQYAASLVAAAMLQAGSTNGAVNVLEIGSGTGNLTVQLLDAVKRSRAVSQIFGRLVAIDKAVEMVTATEIAIENRPYSDRVNVQRGFAFRDLGEGVRDCAPFSVICGTLVLSHLLQSEVEERLEAVMAACKELLTPTGSVVLADALVPDPRERDVLENRWRQAMVHRGLPPARAEHFLRHNREMLETATEQELQVAAKRHGFDLRIHTTPGFDSPFRAIVLERRG